MELEMLQAKYPPLMPSLAQNELAATHRMACFEGSLLHYNWCTETHGVQAGASG